MSPEQGACDDGLVCVEDGFEGPESIGYARFPGAGTSYYFKLAGHDVQLYVTEKRKLVRVFVDGKEYKP